MTCFWLTLHFLLFLWKWIRILLYFLGKGFISVVLFWNCFLSRVLFYEILILTRQMIAISKKFIFLLFWRFLWLNYFVLIHIIHPICKVFRKNIVVLNLHLIFIFFRVWCFVCYVICFLTFLNFSFWKSLSFRVGHFQISRRLSMSFLRFRFGVSLQ